MKQITIYSSVGCHLCDDVKNHLYTAIDSLNLNNKLEIAEIDVFSDAFEKCLFESDFWQKVPVISYKNKFIYYPFEYEELVSFIKQENN